MQNHYILIDYENVRIPSLALLKEAHFHVRVFLGPKNSRLDAALDQSMQEFRERAEYITLKAGGANALDFHIAYYLGVLVTTDPSALFHVISKDTGFDPLIEHLQAKNIQAQRSASIEAMPCFRHKTAPNDSGPQLTDELFQLVIADLIKRKKALPRSSRTLWSTINARCGKELPVSVAEAIYEALVNLGVVKVEGKRLTYNFPVTD